MKTSRRIIGLLAAFLLLANGPSIFAQFAPPTDAMDTLSEMPTGGVPGGGAPPAPPIGAPGAAPGAAPGGAPGQYYSPEMLQQMSMMGMDPSMMPPGMMPPGMAPGAGVATPTATPTPKRYPALKGQRIYDAVSYRKNKGNPLVLDDVYRIEISEDETQMYVDDGTQGDEVAGDGIYSQILPPSYKDWIGGQSNFFLQRIVAMLQNAEQMDPLNFFGLQAMTTEEFSIVPQERVKVQEQMAKIASLDNDQFSGWAQTFLKDYRVEQGDRESKFFPLYVPRYPEPPSSPPPPAPWRPYNHPDLLAADAGTQGSQFGAFPGGMGYPMMPGGAPTPINSFSPVGRARDAAGLPPR